MIVVIGILAAITIVSYNGAREKGMTASLINDLKNAQDAMEIAAIAAHQYPTALPADIQTSAGVTLNLKTTPVLPHYSSLSGVQNGVLLSQICQDLINEGKGSGVNLGGGTDPYITGCGNWNSDSMQITGWDSKVYSTPLADSTLTNYANSYNKGDAYHPNQNAVVKGFYNALHDRFITEGGTFPVTSFWDNWANSGNGGVIKQDLPDPDPPEAYANTFCIEADYAGNKVPAWHVIQDSQPSIGGC